MTFIGADQVRIVNVMNLSRQTFTFESCVTRPGIQPIVRFVADNGHAIFLKKNKTGKCNGYYIMEQSGARWKIKRPISHWVDYGGVGSDVASFFER